MADARYRIYDEFDCRGDGYPFEWNWIKADVRERAGHRCVRCGHPYRAGEHGTGEWSPCDERCTHPAGIGFTRLILDEARVPILQEAHWRILTVHHLDGVKANCRWWNLVALCQRCHLEIQGRVKMERAFILEHSEWFRPYAAGWYSLKYEGREITREEAIERMDELLAYERIA